MHKIARLFEINIFFPRNCGWIHNKIFCMILRMNTKISFIFFYDILLKLGFPRNSYIFCAKFALFSRKFYFCELLRYFCAWNAMSFARFCAIYFAQFAQNWKYFLRKLRMKRNFSFAQFAQNRKFYAKCNFLGKLSKIDILSLELNNWRFIPYTKKILTYEYDNDYTTLNWLLPVTKSLN